MGPKESLLGDIYAISTALSWSFAVILFRKAGFSLGTIPSKALQNILATCFFFIAIFVLQQPVTLSLSLDEWIALSLSAVLGITIGDTLFIASLNRIGASSQAIVDGLYSPLLALSGYYIFQESIGSYEILGGCLVIAGVVAGAKKSKHFQATSQRQLWEGYLLGIFAQVALVYCIVLIRDLLQDNSVLVISAYRFLIGTSIYWLLILLTPRRSTLFSGFRWNRCLLLNFSGTFVGPFLATLFWFLGFKHSPLARAGIYNQLSTIFIILLAAYILKERLSKLQVFAVILSISGIFLVSL